MKQWKPGDPLTDNDLELLQPLILSARKTGLTPTTKEIPSASKIKSRFRLWKHAVAAAGLPSLNSPEQTQLRQAMYCSRQSTPSGNTGCMTT